MDLSFVARMVTGATLGVFALIGSHASAAVVTPINYTFDQPTGCGTFCYGDPSLTKLTDGVVVSGFTATPYTYWVGWHSTPTVNIDFDFGAQKKIDTVNFGSMQDCTCDVTLPSLSVFSSNDGSTWALKGSLAVPASSGNNGFSGFLTLSGLAVDSRFVRVQTSANGQWTFADEVTFSGAGAASVPEPGVWGMMLIGFGAIGALGRSRARRALS